MDHSVREMWQLDCYRISGEWKETPTIGDMKGNS